MWLASKKSHKPAREPRFPNTGLTTEQHDLAFTVRCLEEAPPQQSEFFFAPDEGGQAGRVQCLEAACHGTRLKHRPRPHRPGNTLNAPRSKIIELEETAEKSSRAFSHDDHIWCGETLQARRKVRRLAYYAALLRLARLDEVADHDQSGCNTNPDLQGGARVEPSHSRSQIKASPYSSLGVVLVGVRIAKVHEDTIPQIAGDKTTELAYGFRDAFLIN
jgi:hypothetical protein